MVKNFSMQKCLPLPPTKLPKNKNRAIPHLAEVFCGYTVILPTGHSMNVRQHLIFGLDELCFVRTGNNKRCSHLKPGTLKMDHHHRIDYVRLFKKSNILKHISTWDLLLSNIEIRGANLWAPHDPEGDGVNIKLLSIHPDASKCLISMHYLFFLTV